MPVTGLLKKNQKIVRIWDYEFPKLEIPRGSIQCPFCKEDLSVKTSLLNNNFFSHLPNSKCSEIVRNGSGGESFQHSLQKAMFMNLLQSTQRYNACEFYIEQPVDFLGVKRRPDILIKSPMGYYSAFEIQLSQIQPQDLIKRTNEYSEKDISVFWLFGKSAKTQYSKPENRKYLFKAEINFFFFKTEIINIEKRIPIDDQPRFFHE